MSIIDVEAQGIPFAPHQAPHSDPQHVRSDIERRLHRVCAGMPPDEFRTLIDQMAAVQIKYARFEQR